MEYHWHKSNLGDLWLCKDAITSLANMNMPDGYRAIDATLLGEGRGKSCHCCSAR